MNTFDFYEAMSTCFKAATRFMGQMMLLVLQITDLAKIFLSYQVV